MIKSIPEYPLEGMPYYKRAQYWVALTNFSQEVKQGIPERIVIHDVTLRDGEQTPGVTFLEDERVRIAEELSDLGVTRIEAGMPSVSPRVACALKRISSRKLKSQIFGFARAVEKDIELCCECGAQGVVIEHTVNPYLCKYAYNLTPQTLVERLVKAVKRAKILGLDTTFMGWDWFRAPIDWTRWLIDAVLSQTELDGLTIVDTFGCTVPDAVETMFRQFSTWFPKLRLEFHGHNDFNLGNACCLSAMKGGAKVIHTAMNGLGERMGNVATEEFAMMMEILQGVATGVNLNKISEAAHVISCISKQDISPNKPILGKRAFQIESGVTTHFVTRLEAHDIDPSSLPFTPRVIGGSGGAEYVLGKNSGKASIEYYLNKHNMSAANDDEVQKIVDEVKGEGYVTKSLVSDAQFMAIVDKIKKNCKERA
jgi:isopropylmalate/homocitrate/citramalate synthase